MTLIICSECGYKFSDKAPSCPQCGCPTELARPTAEPTPPSARPPIDPMPTAAKGGSILTPAASSAQVNEPEAEQSGEISYVKRRAACSPELITAATLFAPPFSAIWGVRQKSWELAIVPTALFAIATFIFNAPVDGERDLKRSVGFRSMAAAAAYSASKRLKDQSKKRNSNIISAGTPTTPKTVAANDAAPVFTTSQSKASKVNTEFTNPSENLIGKDTKTTTPARSSQPNRHGYKSGGMTFNPSRKTMLCAGLAFLAVGLSSYFAWNYVRPPSHEEYTVDLREALMKKDPDEFDLIQILNHYFAAKAVLLRDDKSAFYGLAGTPTIGSADKQLKDELEKNRRNKWTVEEKIEIHSFSRPARLSSSEKSLKVGIVFSDTGFDQLGNKIWETPKTLLENVYTFTRNGGVWHVSDVRPQ